MSRKLCTLLFLLKDGEILLAMKKRGFGAGRWNGVGGKVEPNETIEQGLVRECREEIGVTPLRCNKVAIHNFLFPNGSADIEVHAFVTNTWRDKPIEMEEMAPQWFKLADIPYDQMWQDDRYWLPHTLKGKKLHGTFTFNHNEQMLDYKLTEVATLA